MKFWTRIIVAFVVIWGVAAGVIFLAHAAKPTPQKVSAYLSESLAGKSRGDRAARIGRAADLLNGLTLEDRRQLRGHGATEKFFKSLTPEEQGRFLDATLPTGFKQMMANFNRMDPAKRKQFVERALTEMKKHEDEAAPPRLDDANQQKIINQGFRSFYNDASADVKLDMAPLIEQMQKANFAR